MLDISYILIIASFCRQTCTTDLANIWYKVTSHLSNHREYCAAPAVCLLVAVCDHQHNEDQEHVLKWCVDNGFELIEWTLEGNLEGMYIIAITVSVVV